MHRTVGGPQTFASAVSNALRPISRAVSVLRGATGARRMSRLTRWQRLIAFLCVNMSFMLVEFVYGYVNNSLGMLSDAAHMLLDNAAVVIGMLAEVYAVRYTSNGSTKDPDR